LDQPRQPYKSKHPGTRLKLQFQGELRCTEPAEDSVLQVLDCCAILRGICPSDLLVPQRHLDVHVPPKGIWWNARFIFPQLGLQGRIDPWAALAQKPQCLALLGRDGRAAPIGRGVSGWWIRERCCQSNEYSSDESYGAQSSTSR